MCRTRPWRAHEPGTLDVLWPTALDGDPACRFVRDAIIQMAEAVQGRVSKRGRT